MPSSAAEQNAPAARLLRQARSMAGLTQAEVAQRAGVPRQVITTYESGMRRPTVGTLEGLLVGCGMRLQLSLVPEPGLEDSPTRELLRVPPAERLDCGYRHALVDLAESVADPSLMLVSGKSAARLHGACVKVTELEVWFSDRQPAADIAGWLTAAGLVPPVPATPMTPLTLSDLREGVLLTHDGVHVKVQAEPRFAGYLSRSAPLDLTPIAMLAEGERLLVGLADPTDCARGWFPRDRDHLALQRAIRIAAEGSAAG
jgi:transcriptional regulator with XRE-family HTH domain